jgi:hypothetical protein
MLESADSTSPSSNTKGVLHELLVGYHLNGGKHMEKHKDVDGSSPEEAHDKLKSSMSQEDYNNINEKAKYAAEHVKGSLKEHGKIHAIHWTSKPGDIHRSTGIHSSQTEDASDIVVTTKKGNKTKHHGISLKVTDRKTGHVPVSNPGMNSTFGADKILQDHRDGLDKKYPTLKSTSKTERKEFVKNNPKVKEEISKRNTQVLSDMVDHTHSQLEKLPSHKLAEHIRNHILKARPTPMQTMGHNHIRHTTYGSGGDYSAHALDPSQEHEHILTDHKNITVHKSGSSIIFKHNGTSFARQRMKFESQSDPKSSIKGSGELIG